MIRGIHAMFYTPAAEELRAFDRMGNNRRRGGRSLDARHDGRKDRSHGGPDVRSPEAPQFPVGPFVPEDRFDPARRDQLIAEIEGSPAALRTAVRDLSEGQLEARYRNWTVRQIAHHIADSHLNGFIRHRLALTEDRPTIKPYDESRWVLLEDSRTLGLAPTLALLDGLHARWVHLLRSVTPDQFARTYRHPEYRTEVTLFESMSNYAWHGRHHTAQIRWMRLHRLGLTD